MSALGATAEPWRAAMLLKCERIIAEVEITGTDAKLAGRSISLKWNVFLFYFTLSEALSVQANLKLL